MVSQVQTITYNTLVAIGSVKGFPVNNTSYIYSSLSFKFKDNVGQLPLKVGKATIAFSEGRKIG